MRARRAGDDPRVGARATRTSTPPARTTSAPTRRRSCRRSLGVDPRLPRACGGSSRTAAARCPYHWGRFKGMAAGPRLGLSTGSLTTSSSTRACTTSRASTCSSTWCRSTTSCSHRRWSAPCGASIPTPATTTTTRSYIDHAALDATAKRADLRGQRAARVPEARVDGGRTVTNPNARNRHVVVRTIERAAARRDRRARPDRYRDGARGDRSARLPRAAHPADPTGRAGRRDRR